jgi:hypothetical protein
MKNSYMPHKLKHYMNLNTIVKSEEEFNEICVQNAEINNINFHIESKIIFFGANKAENSNNEVSKEKNILVVLTYHGMNKSFILDHLTPQDTKSAADFFAQTIWRQKL